MQERFQRIVTWVKQHPWLAAGIVGSVVLLAIMLRRRSSEDGEPTLPSSPFDIAGLPGGEQNAPPDTLPSEAAIPPLTLPPETLPLPLPSPGGSLGDIFSTPIPSYESAYAPAAEAANVPTSYAQTLPVTTTTLQSQLSPLATRVDPKAQQQVMKPTSQATVDLPSFLPTRPTALTTIQTIAQQVGLTQPAAPRVDIKGTQQIVTKPTPAAATIQPRLPTFIPKRPTTPTAIQTLAQQVGLTRRVPLGVPRQTRRR